MPELICGDLRTDMLISHRQAFKESRVCALSSRAIIFISINTMLTCVCDVCDDVTMNSDLITIAMTIASFGWIPLATHLATFAASEKSPAVFSSQLLKTLVKVQ